MFNKLKCYLFGHVPVKREYNRYFTTSYNACGQFGLGDITPNLPQPEYFESREELTFCKRCNKKLKSETIKEPCPVERIESGMGI